MSGQPSQRIRKTVSPAGSATKQGPIRAIVPLSLMQTCSPTRCLKGSPSPPVNWSGDGTNKVKTRLSPDNRISPDSQSSPVARAAEKSKTLTKTPVSSSSYIRRTASVDTIYLLGQWQRDALYLSYCGRLMMDRATQTPDEFEEIERKQPVKKQPAPTATASTETLEMKYIRQRLQRPVCRRSPVQGDHSACGGGSPSISSPHHNNASATLSSFATAKALPIPIPPKPLIPRMRSSVEGLNQEIERIVLREISSTDGDDAERPLEAAPEGHRAPIADLFRHTQSVDTQTPFGRCHSSDSSSSHSLSPVHLDSSRPSSAEGSKGSGSPDLEGTHKFATSPHINKFLAREPPDGCEKVKIAEENRNSIGEFHEFSCPKPSRNFVLLPSQRSAFDPLCKNCGALSTPNGDIVKPGAPSSSKKLQ